ncbi:uncharacterized protein CDV56_103560 [Aspergillus thermomutatus]|uniref:Uncharacterized protein n=1 Tax=Aspergillus thermomutatus TaxID=41047 RepID=A0A397HQG4_ASPTH|nr:uncharacterized protein CDV56_103560 [Aspergillus thermomutatus]RHZ65167.1 hypothetical protein CDV56_103560 [Aspergillus thermomutatus]
MSHALSPPFTPDSEFAGLETPRVPCQSLRITALARFEFEAGKGNDGTKILMVEWEDDDLGRSADFPGGSWHVSWEGKKTVLPADERTSENTRRFYFLLPPHATIPPVVTLSYEPPATSSASSTPTQKTNSLQLNPLPAIFPPELGATGRSAGKKGVLHTIWAKKRLQVLDKEIREECMNNAEGIALHMALQEKEWIESNFGVGSKSESQTQAIQDSQYPMGPTTPVSPSSGGKLGEKLKGLKLQTSQRELSSNMDGMDSSRSSSSTPTNGPAASSNARHLLSPQSPDVAVSSFNSFHTMQPTSNAALHPSPAPDTTLRTVVHYPPESIQAQQNSSDHNSGFASMTTLARTSSADSGEDLFAKALSPRSPDLPRSPFSFAPETLQM